MKARGLPWLVSLAALGVTVVVIWPALLPPPPAVCEFEGVRPVRHPDAERIEAVLLERAPGWGLTLRSHVARAIAEESEAAGFDPLFVLAVIEVESEFREQATSVMGARGLMQLRGPTLGWVAQREGLKLTRAELESDPALNVRLGVRYLRYLKDSFRGRLDLALMAYNAGPNRVRGALKAKTTDTWASYVSAVRREYAALKRAHGEAGDLALASRETVDDVLVR